MVQPHTVCLVQAVLCLVAWHAQALPASSYSAVNYPCTAPECQDMQKTALQLLYTATSVRLSAALLWHLNLSHSQHYKYACRVLHGLTTLAGVPLSHIVNGQASFAAMLPPGRCPLQKLV